MPIMPASRPVIEINLTPNRPDAAGVHGIARDLAAAGLGRLKDHPLKPVEGGFSSPFSVRLDFAESDAPSRARSSRCASCAA